MNCEPWLYSRLGSNDQDDPTCKWIMILRGAVFVVCSCLMIHRLHQLARPSLGSDSTRETPSMIAWVRNTAWGTVMHVIIERMQAWHEFCGGHVYCQVRGKLSWIRYAQAGVLAILAAHSVYIALTIQVNSCHPCLTCAEFSLQHVRLQKKKHMPWHYSLGYGSRSLLIHGS